MSDGESGDEVEKSDAVAGQNERFVMRCASCRYWKGDKDKAKSLFEENPISMDLLNGWPNSGDCSVDYEWLKTEICGDASVTHEVPANFGCVYYCA